MLKPITVFLLTIVFITGTMQGQSFSQPSKDSQMSLKQAISRETEKLKNESAAIDPKKMDKIERQTSQKSWNTKNTLIITGIVVVLVGLAIVLAHNTKRCIRRNPSGCSFADDIDCQCTEYAK